jgi:paraquat-inducible protein A
MRWHLILEEWAMPEVYMLGILVAYSKMMSMGQIIPGLGLFCFIGMLVSVILTKTSYNTELAFDLLDQRAGQ